MIQQVFGCLLLHAEAEIRAALLWAEYNIYFGAPSSATSRAVA